jgi:glycosyltransferase involved in cell wall biosynthesis
MPGSSSYVLWLPSWYPNKLAPYDGDFIQRHARAVAAFIPVHVLYLVRDKKKVVTGSVYFDEKQTGNLTETIIYYSSRDMIVEIADKFLSAQKFGNLYRTYLSGLFQKKGMPFLVHAHIAFKGGLIAGWIKKKYGISYFLSEQWTIYLDEAVPNIASLSPAKKYLISKAIKKAEKIFPVSDYLGKTIQKKWPSIQYKVIPNVVNTTIFYPDESCPDDCYRLVHISNLNYQKDPEKLFEAIKILKTRGIKLTLDVFGPSDDYIRSLVAGNGLEQVVKLHEEVPQPVLAEYLRRSDALILYSRYETFGCVIIEANACGLPVIVTDTPLMHELVKPGENGVLVKPGSAEALAAALKDFFDKRNQFNKKLIAESTQRYSYNEIGKMFFDEYISFNETKS